MLPICYPGKNSDSAIKCAWGIGSYPNRGPNRNPCWVRERRFHQQLRVPMSRCRVERMFPRAVTERQWKRRKSNITEINGDIRADAQGYQYPKAMEAEIHFS